ncbi:MAG: S16 family serine protease [Burkholderiaceae bacterium]
MRYASRQPLPINATLVFEQSYGPVDGDSATVAELCALVSALAGIAVRQDIAITGSMNQVGEVQAVGGLNDKIEGFLRDPVRRAA